MTLSDLSIRRPVLATMISLALVLFGAIGYTRLAVREFPDVDPPIVSVNTQPGDSSSLACARQASSRSRMASNPGEQVVVGGQERLSQGAPAAVTLVDRTPPARRED